MYVRSRAIRWSAATFLPHLHRFSGEPIAPSEAGVTLCWCRSDTGALRKKLRLVLVCAALPKSAVLAAHGAPAKAVLQLWRPQ